MYPIEHLTPWLPPVGSGWPGYLDLRPWQAHTEQELLCALMSPCCLLSTPAMLEVPLPGDCSVGRVLGTPPLAPVRLRLPVTLAALGLDMAMMASGTLQPSTATCGHHWDLSVVRSPAMFRWALAESLTHRSWQVQEAAPFRSCEATNQNNGWKFSGVLLLVLFPPHIFSAKKLKNKKIQKYTLFQNAWVSKAHTDMHLNSLQFFSIVGFFRIRKLKVHSSPWLLAAGIF